MAKHDAFAAGCIQRAIGVAQRYPDYGASEFDLAAVRAEAWRAVRYAVNAAKWEHSWESALGVARNVSRAKAWDATWDAAAGTARETAWTSCRAAGWEAGFDASRAAEEAWQRQRFAEMMDTALKERGQWAEGYDKA